MAARNWLIPESAGAKPLCGRRKFLRSVGAAGEQGSGGCPFHFVWGVIPANLIAVLNIFAGLLKSPRVGARRLALSQVFDAAQHSRAI